MRYDLVTIGDIMKDIFVFPAEDEMEKPINRSAIERKVHGENFLLFEFGDKITISDIHYDIGGTAGNVAAGVAKLGLKAGIISKIGRDAEGEEIFKKLKEAEVSSSLIETTSEKKTSFSIIISYHGERSILAFHSFKPTEFEIPENLNTDWLYVGALGEGYKPLYTKITALAAEKNINLAINPGSVQIHDGLNSFGGLLRVSKVLFVNKEEGQNLAGLHGVANVRDIINVLKKTGVEIVVLTDGKEGAYAATEDKFYRIGPYPGHRLEATGAGDSFASAFLAGLIKGEKIFTCLQWGVTNSASVIEKVGATAGLLNLTTIKSRVRGYRWPANTLRFS